MTKKSDLMVYIHALRPIPCSAPGCAHKVFMMDDPILITRGDSSIIFCSTDCFELSCEELSNSRRANQGIKTNLLEKLGMKRN